MESIPNNRIFEFNQDQMKCVRKQYNLEKLGDMSRAIDVLVNWIKTQEHFMKKDLPRDYLEKVILANKGSLERAKNRLDKMYTSRTLMPHFFGENLTKDVSQNVDIFKNILLPKPTQENNRVYILKATGSTFTSDLVTNCYKYMILVCEYIMAYDYNDGIIAIVDYNDVNLFELIKFVTLTEMRQLNEIVLGSFGMRLHGIHILTKSKAVDTLILILKQVLSPKLAKRIFVHNNINDLHQIVPKEILPVEYGGMEKPLVQLRDELKDELSSKTFMKYIKEMNKATTDESRRQTDTFNEKYFGTPGSFRTINVD